MQLTDGLVDAPSETANSYNVNGPRIFASDEVDRLAKIGGVLIREMDDLGSLARQFLVYKVLACLCCQAVQVAYDGTQVILRWTGTRG